ncbi:hypothetical protein ACRRTK_002428 [Alexandromys fortis]
MARTSADQSGHQHLCDNQNLNTRSLFLNFVPPFSQEEVMFLKLSTIQQLNWELSFSTRAALASGRTVRASVELGSPDRSALQPAPVSPSQEDEGNATQTAEDGDRLRGHGQREPRGHAFGRPPQRCEAEAEARGALSKAGASASGRLGRCGEPGGPPEPELREPRVPRQEQRRPGTGPGGRPEHEQSPKGRPRRSASERERQGAARSGQRAAGRRAGEERRGRRERSGAERSAAGPARRRSGAQSRAAEPRRPGRSASRGGHRWHGVKWRGARGSRGARHYECGAAATAATAPVPRTAPRRDGGLRLAGRAAEPRLPARERERGAETTRERPATPI